MNSRINLLPLVGIMLMFLPAKSQDAMGWRGLKRTGFYETGKLQQKWPDGGPELLLLVDSLPETYSSAIVQNNVIYTTGVVDEKEVLTALTMDGKKKWSVIYGEAWDGSYDHARCTPTLEGGNAYLTSGSGDVACIDLTSGKQKWGYDAFEKFEGDCGGWGIAESPLLVDEKMIFTPGGEKTTMIALDKKTGETVWKSESLDDETAYCSPTLMEENGKKLIVSVTSNYVIGVDAENGKFVWKFKYTDVEKPFMGGDINPITPLIRGKEVFVTSGYNHVGLMLQLSDDLSTVTVKWMSEDLDTHHGGVVYHDGHIYGSNFTSIRKGNWICLDWETGKTRYDHKWLGKGSIIAADGMLICYEERRGNLALVKANPQQFELLSSFRITNGKGPHWSHPSIYDDKLFIRHGDALMVYKIN